MSIEPFTLRNEINSPLGSGIGCLVSEEWPLPTRLLQLLFLSDEEIGGLLSLITLYVLYKSQSSQFSQSHPLMPPSFLSWKCPTWSGAPRELSRKGQLAERVANSFLGSHFIFTNSSPNVIYFFPEPNINMHLLCQVQAASSNGRFHLHGCFRTRGPCALEQKQLRAEQSCQVYPPLASENSMGLTFNRARLSLKTT